VESACTFFIGLVSTYTTYTSSILYGHKNNYGERNLAKAIGVIERENYY